MKLRRSQVRRQAYALPEIRFENQAPTSFSGPVLFQRLFAELKLRDRLHGCFRHLPGGKPIRRPSASIACLCRHGRQGVTEHRNRADRKQLRRAARRRSMFSR